MANNAALQCDHPLRVAFSADEPRVLPAWLVAFLLLELLLDYTLELNFRQTRLLVPYLLLYYAALMGMIGCAFLTSERLGVVTLATYLGQLAATAYSDRIVGHGDKSPHSPTLHRGHK